MATTAPPAAPAPDRPRTPEEIERDWFENVYQGDRMRQLTIRAVVMGMLLGAIMVCSNVYVGLKAGWSMGVAITSCILAYTAFATLHKLFPKQFPPFTILENNAMSSVASAARRLGGSAAGGCGADAGGASPGGAFWGGGSFSTVTSSGVSGPRVTWGRGTRSGGGGVSTARRLGGSASATGSGSGGSGGSST